MLFKLLVILQVLKLYTRVNIFNNDDINKIIIKKISQISNAAETSPSSRSNNSSHFVMVHNPTLNNLQNVIKKNSPSLYSYPHMKAVFPEGSIKCYIWKREKL